MAEPSLGQGPKKQLDGRPATWVSFLAGLAPHIKMCTPVVRVRFLLEYSPVTKDFSMFLE
jgi:hypothetical protein